MRQLNRLSLTMATTIRSLRSSAFTDHGDLQVNFDLRKAVLTLTSPVWAVPYGLFYCARRTAMCCFGSVIDKESDDIISDLLEGYEEFINRDEHADAMQADLERINKVNEDFRKEKEAHDKAVASQDATDELTRNILALGSRPVMPPLPVGATDKDVRKLTTLYNYRRDRYDSQVTALKELSANTLALNHNNAVDLVAPRPPEIREGAIQREKRLAMEEETRPNRTRNKKRKFRRTHEGLFLIVSYVKAIVPVESDRKSQAITESVRELCRKAMQERNWRLTDIAKWLPIATEMVRTPTEADIMAKKFAQSSQGAQQHARLKAFGGVPRC